MRIFCKSVGKGVHCTHNKRKLIFYLLNALNRGFLEVSLIAAK